MPDAITASSGAGRTQAGRTALASNLETFLTLLTAQLRNQDPLSPVDSNEFTAQLTQLAGVEQQLLTNDLLTSLLSSQQGGGLSDAALYIGKKATAAWSATRLEDRSATWNYELGTNAETATVEVVNGNGQVVFTADAPQTESGIHEFIWDGKNSDGQQLPDGGVYTLRISAETASGASISSQVLTRGRVTGVEIFDGQPFLTIGNSIVPLSTVIALEESRAFTDVQPTPDNDDDASRNALATLASNLNPLKLFS